MILDQHPLLQLAYDLGAATLPPRARGGQYRLILSCFSIELEPSLRILHDTAIRAANYQSIGIGIR